MEDVARPVRELGIAVKVDVVLRERADGILECGECGAMHVGQPSRCWRCGLVVIDVLRLEDEPQRAQRAQRGVGQ